MTLIQKYKPEWVGQFENLKSELEKYLGSRDFRIEHVGSTSVSNLDAKDIIDLDIVYFEVSDFEEIKTRLINAGYYHNGNQGIENRDVFKRRGDNNNKVFDSITHHLYVCLSGSEPLERHILSRDFLRKNEWARVKYQTLKYDLAEQSGQNKKKYAQLKELHVNEFIDSIVEQEKENIFNKTTQILE
jgi:GrpB-like predicted nucleotidyltransferase (UPF0157 family)